MKQNFVILENPIVRAYSAAQSEFSSPRHISGHTIIKMPRLHLSCVSAAAQIGGAGAKAWFCLRENLIHENSFELTKEIVERKGETCRSPPYGGSAAVSPLCAAHCRAHP